MGQTETLWSTDSSRHEVQVRQGSLISSLKPIIEEFLASIQYKTPPRASRDALRNAMLSYAASSGVPYDGCKHASQCFLTGVSVAGDMYPSHHLDVQTHIGIFTWLGFLIDDTNKSIASDLACFQPRFLTGQQQPTVLLECFAENLRGTYKFWDPVVANFIVLNALAFVNANVLETRREFQTMVPLKAASSWAYHFRNVEGLPEVYAYFMFPKAAYPDMGVYLQAVPDMGKFINFGNDILSFYKEEVVGETRNYLHSRAQYEEKPIMTVMAAVTQETTQAYLKISEVLEGQDQYARVWKEYVAGYVAMHLKSARYLLSDIGLDVSS
ncbi:unnamed protein product [Discula destructiva]